MTVQANFFAFPMVNNISYKLYIYNQLMLSNNICFNISNSLLRDANNDLHFDGFILNNKAINHELSLDETRDMSKTCTST